MHTAHTHHIQICHIHIHTKRYHICIQRPTCMQTPTYIPHTSYTHTPSQHMHTQATQTRNVRTYYRQMHIHTNNTPSFPHACSHNKPEHAAFANIHHRHTYTLHINSPHKHLMNSVAGLEETLMSSLWSQHRHFNSYVYVKGMAVPFDSALRYQRECLPYICCCRRQGTWCFSMRVLEPTSHREAESTSLLGSLPGGCPQLSYLTPKSHSFSPISWKYSWYIDL